MLQLTAEAAVEIQSLQPRHLPDHKFARVSSTDGKPEAARLTFVAAPRSGDHVGESQGIALCVSEELGDRVSEMVLDVRLGSSGGFYVRAPRTAREPVHAAVS